MFDVVHFPRPIKCKICGNDHISTQTKCFENLLQHYYVGDIVDETDVILGIIKETIFCEHKEETETKYHKQPIYFIIWHKVLIDIVEDINIAEQKLTKFGIGDLYFLYEIMFGKKTNFERKYSKLRNYVDVFVDYVFLDEKQKEEFKNEKDNGFFRNFTKREIIEALKDKETLKNLIKKIDDQDTKKCHSCI